jgi:hypothetical protein
MRASHLINETVRGQIQIMNNFYLMEQFFIHPGGCQGHSIVDRASYHGLSGAADLWRLPSSWLNLEKGPSNAAGLKDAAGQYNHE